MCFMWKKNPVTADSVRKKIKQCLGEKSVAMVQIVLNIENMYLYLTHESKDAIEKKKHKYDKADIKHINNFDIDRYVTLDAEQKDDILDEVCNIIADHRLANILELKKFCNGKRFRVWTAEYESYQFGSALSYWIDSIVF